MASRRCIMFLSIVVVIVLFYISWYPCSLHDHDYESVSTKTFDVDSFGAKGDGKKDDAKAFKKAWKEACSSTEAAVFSVPKNKKYLVTPIKFKDERHWLRVDGVDNLQIEGGGVIDGNGAIWWNHSCKVDKDRALTLYECTTLVVNNLKVQNAQQMHVSFDNCENVQVSNMIVVAPEDSPNTDGIHVTRTQNIKISDSVIGTGDDCISIVNGSKDVQATVSGVWELKKQKLMFQMLQLMGLTLLERQMGLESRLGREDQEMQATLRLKIST
ncbi:Glycoside hydrolase, family 28 [Cynara cardunculus var. scolymus]|uniref:Glycoside hydrolase, family 28 n=1 Tax=Cynara cardunculus var. scolymus TaxID=59895 RepID=A0A103YN57_CYNCS|nr:Glycoside hydrolase, family 28 [Cynara cardunculus var. scolymus]